MEPEKMEQRPDVHFDPALVDSFSSLGLVFAVVNVNVRVAPTPPELDEALGALNAPSARPSAHMEAMRMLYWRTGVDPTKRRPSSEALWKAKANGSLPRINNVVDCCNLISMQSGFPCSIFDARRLSPPLYVTRATDETFRPVTKRTMSLEEGMLILLDSDRTRVICAGYATADAFETRIRPTTDTVVPVVYVPPGADTNNADTAPEPACISSSGDGGGQYVHRSAGALV